MCRARVRESRRSCTKFDWPKSRHGSRANPSPNVLRPHHRLQPTRRGLTGCGKIHFFYHGARWAPRAVPRHYTLQDAQKGRPARPQRAKWRIVLVPYGEPLSDARTPLADFFRILLLLAGGWVYSALVEPSTTTDIDLLILLDPPSREQIRALVSSLFDSTIIHPNPMALQGISDLANCGNPLRTGSRDRLPSADSAYLRTASEREHTVPFGALQVPMLSIEDLVILKMVAGRLQDRADLEKIRTRERTYASMDVRHRWKTDARTC